MSSTSCVVERTAQREAAAAPQSTVRAVLVRVHLYSTLDIKQTTAVSLPGDTTMAQVLEFCCRKRKIDPKEYTLKMADTVTDVPLKQTLLELGLEEFCLLRKDRGPSGKCCYSFGPFLTLLTLRSR